MAKGFSVEVIAENADFDLGEEEEEQEQEDHEGEQEEENESAAAGRIGRDRSGPEHPRNNFV